MYIMRQAAYEQRSLLFILRNKSKTDVTGEGAAHFSGTTTHPNPDTAGADKPSACFCRITTHPSPDTAGADKAND